MASLPYQWCNLAILTIIFAVYTGVRFGLGMMYPLAAKALLGEEHAWYTPYTLPNVMFYVVDIATVIPMSNFMKKYGRRRAFLVGSVFGVSGALAGIGALRLSSSQPMLAYLLLTASALMVGMGSFPLEASHASLFSRLATKTSNQTLCLLSSREGRLSVSLVQVAFPYP